jgi:acetyltransferase-like isoleucine patch superfamily enzyme
VYYIFLEPPEFDGKRMGLLMLINSFKRFISWGLRTYRIKSNPISYARKQGVTIGTNCKLGNIDSGTFGTEPFLIKLGDHVEVTSGVRFITHDGAVWVFREKEPNLDVFGRIDIGNNVFIGMNSIVLAGVTIGDNVIIGAGSVVSKDIPSNVVAAGTPAKPIRPISEYRQKIKSKELHIRNWPFERKKKFLVEEIKNAKK